MTVFESYKQAHPLRNTILNEKMKTSSIENAFKVIYICIQVILFSQRRILIEIKNPDTLLNLQLITKIVLKIWNFHIEISILRYN